MPAADDLTLEERVAMLRLPTDSSPNRPRSSMLWLPWLLCFLLAASTLSLFARGVWKNDGPVPETSITSVSAENESASTVHASVASPTVAPGGVALESRGYIVAAHQIQVSPIEVAGRIIESAIEEGRRFKKGDVLAVLDRSSYEAEYLEAMANMRLSQSRLEELRNGARPEEIASSFAELKETEESLKQARLEYERSKDLTTGINAGALSAKDFEIAQFAYTSLLQKVKRLEKIYELVRLGPRKERIDAAAAELNSAEARVKRAKWRLDNCTIRAPLDGTILKKSAEVGNLVSPLSFNVSASICEMADLSDLEVDLEIPERDISKVLRGMKCKVTTDAYPNRQYDGTVDRLMPIALQNKAAIQVRVKLDVPKSEEGVYLKPGMNARVTFLQPAKEKP